MRVGHLIEFIEKCRNFRFEGSEVLVDDIPDYLPVYLEITMDHLVPHTGNLPPCDIRMLSLKRCGNAFDGLTYYFNCPYNRVCILFHRSEDPHNSGQH